MSKPQFSIRITGNRLALDSVCVSDLAELLIDTEKAILAAAVGSTVTGERPIISLVKIEEGSCDLTLAMDSRLAAAARLITKGVAEARFSELPNLTWQALCSISKLVVKRGWSLVIPSNPGLKLKRAEISADHPIPEPDTFVANGTTTIYGRCIRVGGLEPKVEVQLVDGITRLHVSVNESMARTLAKRLYEQVGLEGDATWDTRTWRITAFRATRILAYEPTSLHEAFEGLAEIAGKRWQGIDAAAHVERLRAGIQESQ